MQSAEFKSSVQAWFDYAAANPKHAQRLLRQNAHFLVSSDQFPGFHPIRFIIAHATKGTSFSQAGGRSVSMSKWAPVLEDMGYVGHAAGSTGFSTLYKEWEETCLLTGKAICRVSGEDPRNWRVFWSMT